MIILQNMTELLNDHDLEIFFEASGPGASELVSLKDARGDMSALVTSHDLYQSVHRLSTKLRPQLEVHASANRYRQSSISTQFHDTEHGLTYLNTSIHATFGDCKEKHSKSAQAPVSPALQACLQQICRCKAWRRNHRLEIAWTRADSSNPKSSKQNKKNNLTVFWVVHPIDILAIDLKVDSVQFDFAPAKTTHGQGSAVVAEHHNAEALNFIDPRHKAPHTAGKGLRRLRRLRRLRHVPILDQEAQGPVPRHTATRHVFFSFHFLSGRRGCEEGQDRKWWQVASVHGS